MIRLEEAWKSYITGKAKSFRFERFELSEVDSTGKYYVVRLQRWCEEEKCWLVREAVYNRVLKTIVNPETGLVRTVISDTSKASARYFRNYELEEAGMDEIDFFVTSTDIRGVEVNGEMLWTTNHDLLSQIKHFVLNIDTLNGKLGDILRDVSE